MLFLQMCLNFVKDSWLWYNRITFDLAQVGYLAVFGDNFRNQIN